MDLLDDPFAETKVAKVAPIAGRFQPKAKPRPKKPPPAAAKPTTKAPPAASVPKDSVSSQPAENVPAEKDSAAANTADITVTGSSEKPLENGDLSAKAKEMAGSSVAEHSEIAVSGPSQSTDLNADSSLGSKLPPGDLSATTAVQRTEMSNVDASSVQGEEELHFSNVSFASVSPLRPCNSQAAIDKSVDKTSQESESCKESFFCGDGDFQIDVEKLGTGDFSCLDTMDMMSEGAAVSEKRAAKLMPKPKVQGDRQKYPAEAVSHHPQSSMPPSEDQHMSMNGSIHAEEPDTFSDVLHMTLDGNISADPSWHQPDTVVSEDADSLMPENLPKQSGQDQRERKSNVAVDSSVKSVDEELLFEFQGDENENEYGPLDGINDDFYENNNSDDRAPDELLLNREENNDGDNIGEDTSKKKKPRKTKEVASENDEPTRKRRKAAQKPDKSIKKPPKKFPRSTRRKRTVDKALLEAPEEELDLQRVPIKDLIVLAEYKERQAKKEAAAVLPPQNSERIDNMSEDAPYDDNETYGFDQDGDASDNPDDPSTSEVQIDTGYFNYQSHMTKQPRARWTKTDTELFYKGLSQFGSDLSMIQQLFPGRTRHQIKLKYKNEERQNPMRLHDALTSRTQDLSHFKLVIQRLEEQAARDKEDSVSPTGEDEELEEVPNTHDDAAESKNKEEGQAADQEPDRPEVESPKSYYSEQEDFDWSDYKCDF